MTNCTLLSWNNLFFFKKWPLSFNWIAFDHLEHENMFISHLIWFVSFVLVWNFYPMSTSFLNTCISRNFHAQFAILWAFIWKFRMFGIIPVFIYAFCKREFCKLIVFFEFRNIGYNKTAWSMLRLRCENSLDTTPTNNVSKCRHLHLRVVQNQPGRSFPDYKTPQHRHRPTNLTGLFLGWR